MGAADQVAELLARNLMAAGLVACVQVTLFPVTTGQIGDHPIFQDAADFDLELLESRTLDGNIQELIYGPPCMPEAIHAPHPVEQRAFSATE